MLQSLNGFERGVFRGRAGILEPQGKREPDDGPDAGDSDSYGDQEFWRKALFALLRGELGFSRGLVSAAIRANGASGVNWAIAVRAEIHSIRALRA